MNSNDQNIEHISGNVERITFHNPDNGFSIIKIIAATHNLVTAIGNIPMISVGEYIQCQGVWVMIIIKVCNLFLTLMLKRDLLVMLNNIITHTNYSL